MPAASGVAVLLLADVVSGQIADVLVPTTASGAAGLITGLLIAWYRFGPARSVKALFAAVGLDIDGKPSERVWDNIFKAKPTGRLPGPVDLTELRTLLASAHQVFKESDQLRRSLAAREKDDERLTRLSLLYVASFAGSGKTHICRLLCETVDQLRSGEEAVVARLLGAGRDEGSGGSEEPLPGKMSTSVSEGPLFDEATVEWAKQLRLIGVNFNSERWSLDASPFDKEMAGFPSGNLIPLHLRVLFFALADFSDANAANDV